MITRSPARGAARMLGLGAYRPHRVVSNDEVCALLDVDSDWVIARSGIRNRRFADADETLISMGAHAATDALAAAGIEAAQIGATLVATMSQGGACPQVSTQTAHRIGAVAGPAMDLGGACAGFCYALEVAAAMVAAGSATYVLVIGVERMTDIIDPKDRSTAFLFGDGAGAVVVGPSEEAGIGPVAWGADGGQADLIVQSPTFLEASRSTGDEIAGLRMQGPAVFRWATTRMAPLAEEALDAAEVKIEQLDAFVPHQANDRITEGLARALGVPEHVAVAHDVVEAGNTSAASVPLAMHAVLASGAAEPGGHALLLGFGAGLTFASQVVTLPPWR